LNLQFQSIYHIQIQILRSFFQQELWNSR